MTDVCFIVGARPNFMKAIPVHRALAAAEPRLELLLVHTGQHYDREMSSVFLEQLGVGDADVFLGVGSGTHAEQTAHALLGVERTLLDRRPRLVVVAGDVNSTLAGALAAVKIGIPVAHIESGLRSFDWSMPEEHNRRLTDHVSSILLTHSESAVENLHREGLDARSVHLVGNTMIDSLTDQVDLARDTRAWERFGFAPRDYGLVTLHRPALVDDPALLREVVDALVALADHAPLAFPVHPRTAANLTSLGLAARFAGSRVAICEPLDYLSFLALESEARFVLTDSGGIQEETTVLGVPCFTLRDRTERPVTVAHGTNVVLGARPNRIAEIPELLRGSKPPSPIPLWDGRAGERAAAVLLDFLADAERESPEGAHRSAHRSVGDVA